MTKMAKSVRKSQCRKDLKIHEQRRLQQAGDVMEGEKMA